MNSKKTHRRNTNGFTLTEMIVVLVIIVILIALLVPTLVGYIDKAKEKEAIAECRRAVVSTQTLASEKYGSDNEVSGGIAFLAKYKDEIFELAELPEKASINYLSFQNEGTFADGASRSISVLKFTSSSKIKVIYDASKDSKYTIDWEDSGAGKYLSDAQTLWGSNDYINNDKLGDAFVKDNSDAPLTDTEVQLMNEFAEKFGCTLKIDPNTLQWRPVLIRGTDTVLLFTPSDPVTHKNQNTPVFYDGNNFYYYVRKDYKGNLEINQSAVTMDNAQRLIDNALSSKTLNTDDIAPNQGAWVKYEP